MRVTFKKSTSSKSCPLFARSTNTGAHTHTLVLLLCFMCDAYLLPRTNGLFLSTAANQRICCLEKLNEPHLSSIKYAGK